jgi:hypothetical protein
VGCSAKYSAGFFAKDTPRTYVSSICRRAGGGDSAVPVPVPGEGDEESCASRAMPAAGDGDGDGDAGDGGRGDGDGDGALTEGAGDPATVKAGGETSNGVCGVYRPAARVALTPGCQTGYTDVTWTVPAVINWCLDCKIT